MKWSSVPLTLVVTLAACSYGAEQTLLGQFFAASRLRDKTMLANFATVVFRAGHAGHRHHVHDHGRQPRAAARRRRNRVEGCDDRRTGEAAERSDGAEDARRDAAASRPTDGSAGYQPVDRDGNQGCAAGWGDSAVVMIQSPS